MNMQTQRDSITHDPTLRWTMRLTGVLLAVGSIFFLMKDLMLGSADDLVFTAGAGLGLLTFGASLIPPQPVRRRTPRPYPESKTPPVTTP